MKDNGHALLKIDNNFLRNPVLGLPTDKRSGLPKVYEGSGYRMHAGQVSLNFDGRRIFVEELPSQEDVTYIAPLLKEAVETGQLKFRTTLYKITRNAIPNPSTKNYEETVKALLRYTAMKISFDNFLVLERGKPVMKSMVFNVINSIAITGERKKHVEIEFNDKFVAVLRLSTWFSRINVLSLINLKSRPVAQRLYLLLKSFSYAKRADFLPDQLVESLGIVNSAVRKRPSYLYSSYIAPALKDINSKTELKVVCKPEYGTGKTGKRTIKRFHFEIKDDSIQKRLEDIISAYRRAERLDLVPPPYFLNYPILMYLMLTDEDDHYIMELLKRAQDPSINNPVGFILKNIRKEGRARKYRDFLNMENLPPAVMQVVEDLSIKELSLVKNWKEQFQNDLMGRKFLRYFERLKEQRFVEEIVEDDRIVLRFRTLYGEGYEAYESLKKELSPFIIS